MHYPSKIWLSDCSKPGENLTVSTIRCCRIFWPCYISLNKFRTWFRVHVNVSGNIEKLPRLKFIQYLGTGVSMGVLSWVFLMSSYWLQDQIFCHFWIIWWKPKRGKITTYPLTQIKVHEQFPLPEVFVKRTGNT